MIRTPQSGDIILYDFTVGAQGSEMMGYRPALVLSEKKFNASFGQALICPISRGKAELARKWGIAVSLMGTGCRTDGAVLVNQTKSIDFRARQIKIVEKAPDRILQEVHDALLLTLGINI